VNVGGRTLILRSSGSAVVTARLLAGGNAFGRSSRP